MHDVPPMTDGSRRLLLVEPNAGWRVAWRAELEQMAWAVVEAGDVREAMAHQPHIILTNAQLPDANGYHFVRTLRGIVENDVVVAGLVTSPEVGDNINRAGFDFILRPPFDFALFRRRL